MKKKSPLKPKNKTFLFMRQNYRPKKHKIKEEIKFKNKNSLVEE